MAVVPDRRIGITHKLKMLRTNKAIVTAALEKILSTKATHELNASEFLKNSIDMKNQPMTMEPSSSGKVEQPIKDDKLSAVALQNLTILDCGTEKVSRDRQSLALRRVLRHFFSCKFQLDDSGDSEKHMISDDASGPNALDLNSLLKNLESEILVNEQNLNDENDKRYMFKVGTSCAAKCFADLLRIALIIQQVDDCRRTHNYDEFICTFLSMLAQQNVLADLVSQHLIVSRKSVSGLNSRQYKKNDRTKKTSGKRRKGRNKHKKK